jgi:hypothetical protein
VYRLPLRALQGFATNLQRLAMADLAVPMEKLMYRFKTLTGDRLWARDVAV